THLHQHGLLVLFPRAHGNGILHTQKQQLMAMRPLCQALGRLQGRGRMHGKGGAATGLEIKAEREPLHRISQTDAKALSLDVGQGRDLLELALAPLDILKTVESIVQVDHGKSLRHSVEEYSLLRRTSW